MDCHKFFASLNLSQLCPIPCTACSVCCGFYVMVENPYAGVPLAGVAVSPPCLKHTRSTYIKSAK